MRLKYPAALCLVAQNSTCSSLPPTMHLKETKFLKVVTVSVDISAVHQFSGGRCIMIPVEMASGSVEHPWEL